MAIGDLVATISTNLPGSAFFLSNNPGGYFDISGDQILEAINTPAGKYSITIVAAGSGETITQNFTLIYTPLPILDDANSNELQDDYGNFLSDGA